MLIVHTDHIRVFRVVLRQLARIVHSADGSPVRAFGTGGGVAEVLSAVLGEPVKSGDDIRVRRSHIRRLANIGGEVVELTRQDVEFPLAATDHLEFIQQVVEERLVRGRRVGR